MTSDRFRWQTAMGALAGALVADAVANESDTWTPNGLASIARAEAMLSGAPVEVDLAAHEAVPTALGLAVAGAPLLTDSTTVALIDSFALALDAHHVVPDDDLLRQTSEFARAGSLLDAVTAADTSLAPLVGAFVGLRLGLGAVPPHLLSSMRSPDGSKGRRYLSGLTYRLLGLETPNWYDPRNRRGPKEVLPGLWLSNLLGVRRFSEAHPTGLILSLCDEKGRVGDHADHLTFHLEDAPRTDANPLLSAVLDEVLAHITTARLRGQPVLVHCRHGASRTGLILRLLLVDELGLSAEQALIEAQCLWPHTSSWNDDWNRVVEQRSTESCHARG